MNLVLQTSNNDWCLVIHQSLFFLESKKVFLICIYLYESLLVTRFTVGKNFPIKLPPSPYIHTHRYRYSNFSGKPLIFWRSQKAISSYSVTHKHLQKSFHEIFPERHTNVELIKLQTDHISSVRYADFNSKKHVFRLKFPRYELLIWSTCPDILSLFCQRSRSRYCVIFQRNCPITVELFFRGCVFI